MHFDFVKLVSIPCPLLKNEGRRQGLNLAETYRVRTFWLYNFDV